MNEPVKLCKDCRHCEPNTTFFRTTFWLKKEPTEKAWKYSTCVNPKQIGKIFVSAPLLYSLVNGGQPETPEPLSAVVVRMHLCDKQAKWFEPRVTS